MTENPGQHSGSGEPPIPPPVEAAVPPPPPSSYQPPPPSGNQPPAPPAGNAGGFGQQSQGFDPKQLQNFDPKTVNPLDWGIIGAGVVAILFSFFSYYTASLKVSGLGSASGHESAWHGFFGWFSALVALAAAAVLAAHLVAKISFPFPVRLAVLGGFALALLCAILALFIVPIDTGNAGLLGGVKIDKGHGFGYWISALAILVGTVLSLLRFTATGGKLPSKR